MDKSMAVDWNEDLEEWKSRENRCHSEGYASTKQQQNLSCSLR